MCSVHLYAVYAIFSACSSLYLCHFSCNVSHSLSLSLSLLSCASFTSRSDSVDMSARDRGKTDCTNFVFKMFRRIYTVHRAV